jgi:hypothetical protein
LEALGVLACLTTHPSSRWVALQGDASACSGEVLAAGDARAHQQALELLSWQ